MSSPPSCRLFRSLALVLGTAAAAQTPSWSPDWAVAGLGGTVFAFADFNGELHAGGEWFAAKGGVIRGLARFDGTDWQPVGTGIDLVDYSFPPPNTRIRAMTVWNGELVFAGSFDRVNGQPMSYIARWNGSAFAPLGSGLSLSFDEADVRALAVFNNELYAAGQFDTAGGLPAAGIARWNGTSWSAVGGGLRGNNGTSVGYPRAMCVHAGSLIVGGEFDRAGSVVVQNMARWNGTAWLAMGTGSFAPVYALETWNSLLIAAGQFQVGSDVAMPGAWNGSTWSLLGTNQPGVPSTALRTFGGFLYADSGGVLSRFDGTSWSTAGVIAGIFSGVEGTSIRALHTNGVELFLGGQFTRAGSLPNAPSVASANVVAFDGGSGWRTLGTGAGLDRATYRMLPWRGGVVAAGPFSEAGGAPATGIAFHDGDRWNPIARLAGSSQLVYDAAIFQGDLVISGSFTHIDGQPFPGIARFDGTTWHTFGGIAPFGLYSHGGDLFGFGGSALQRWNGSSFVIAATPVSGGVDGLHTHSDGFLYMVNNDAFNHRVLRWTGTQLQSIGTANDFVQTLGSLGTSLLAGGRFTSVNGVAAVLAARWNGTTWSALPAPLSGYAVYSFGELYGDLYAGVSGDPRGTMLRLHNGTWSGLGAGVEGVPVRLFPDPTTDSVIGSGDIILAGGLPSRSMAEWRNAPDWRNRRHGLAGAGTPPLLLGRGDVQAGATPVWFLQTAPISLAAFVASVQRIDAPLLGGTLVPSPDVLLPMITDAQGLAVLSITLALSTPPGLDIWSQAWVLDATGPQGLTATNALQCTTR